MNHIAPGAESEHHIAGLLAALTHIDTVGFHGIATTLTGTDPKIDRNWIGLIRNAGTAVAVTAWPDDITAAAERFTAATKKLAAVLEQRDINAVGGPAKELHIAYHALSDAGWTHLASTAGMAGNDDQHGHQHHH